MGILTPHCFGSGFSKSLSIPWPQVQLTSGIYLFNAIKARKKQKYGSKGYRPASPREATGANLFTHMKLEATFTAHDDSPTVDGEFLQHELLLIYNAPAKRMYLRKQEVDRLDSRFIPRCTAEHMTHGSAQALLPEKAMLVNWLL
jgi:hypothetical protein